MAHDMHSTARPRSHTGAECAQELPELLHLASEL